MMDAKMSQHSKRELVQRLQPRYLQADRQEKTRILDEFVAVTGMHRKAAIRRLRQQNRPSQEHRGRQKTYTGSVVSALVKIWRVCGGICGKRLWSILANMVASLERHQELKLDEATKALLLAGSPATIDRLLRPVQDKPATWPQAGQSVSACCTVRKSLCMRPLTSCGNACLYPSWALIQTMTASLSTS